MARSDIKFYYATMPNTSTSLRS